MSRGFDGATAIVTGGASGIGLALGRALAARGAVVTLADLQGELAEERAAAIREAGGQAVAAPLDVRDAQAFDGLVSATIERHGRLDYLFNNAGIGIGGEVRHYDHSVWHDTFEVNLRGVTNGIQAAYPRMIAQGSGHIVNTASMAGLLLALPYSACYGASKHAVVALSLALRLEAIDAGVRVSALCPGVVKTPILDNGGKFGRMLRAVDDEAVRRIWNRLRPIDPDRFAVRVLRAVQKNRALIIVPGWWRLLWWFERVSPALSMWIARRNYLSFKREACRDQAT